MTDGAGRAPRRRETPAERRARRAEVDDPATVLEAAARFLEARSRSVAEVRRRLTGAGYRVDLVEGAIDRLTELGLLDDEAFGRAWIESRDRARPRGEHALRRELALKGIERSVVDRLLGERRDAAEPGGPGVDRAAADRLLAGQARALARIGDPRRRRARAYALLARHGFDPEVAAEAARTAAARTDEDGEPGDGIED